MILTNRDIKQMRENAAISNSDLSLALDYIEQLIKDNAKLLGEIDILTVEKASLMNLLHNKGDLKNENNV